MLIAAEVLSWESLPPNLEGMNIAVLGIARSGIAVAKLLQKNGGCVLASDEAHSPEIAAAAVELRKAGVETEIGGHSDRVLDADFIVRSPGIPGNIDILQMANRDNLLVVSEIEVASWFCQAPIVAVTGSNGKTTVVEWLGDLLGRAGRKAAVCGNVGRPFSAVVETLSPDDVAVVEVSSFQLEDIVRFHPRVAVITNFSPDHLDRYEDYGDYIAVKSRIFKNQSSADALVYNRHDPEVSRRVQFAAARLISFGADEPRASGVGLLGDNLIIRTRGDEERLLNRFNIGLPGDHNLENALAVVGVASEMGIPADVLRDSLKRFPGVPHRLETVRKENDILWVNDSKATNIASGIVALDSFSEPIILLVGGRDKGSDFRRVAATVAANVRQAILFGEAAPAIESAWRGTVPLIRTATLADAVQYAARSAQAGDVVLLSPMCASFDEFDNYEHRGQTFKDLVQKYVTEKQPQ